MPRAGTHVDVRIDAALADESEPVEPLEERLADRRALADQNQHLGILEPLSQRVDILGVIVPDGDVVAGDLLEAVERLTVSW